jgi:hypothetical protein
MARSPQRDFRITQQSMGKSHGVSITVPKPMPDIQAFQAFLQNDQVDTFFQTVFKTARSSGAKYLEKNEGCMGYTSYSSAQFAHFTVSNSNGLEEKDAGYTSLFNIYRNWADHSDELVTRYAQMHQRQEKEAQTNRAK